MPLRHDADRDDREQRHRRGAGRAVVGDSMVGGMAPRTAEVVLVDAQPLFTRGLQLLLPAVTDRRVQVVEATSDAALAASLVRRRQPDVALVDLGIGPPGGVRAIAAIRRTEPTVPVVALSPSATAVDQGVTALRAGAVGVLEKTVEPEDLVAPLLAIVEGWAVVPRTVLERLLAQAAPSRPRVLDALSLDERRLWGMISEGRTTTQIALALHVSDRTAKRLTAALLRHLRVSSRTEAATLAGRIGLGAHDPGDELAAEEAS